MSPDMLLSSAIRERLARAAFEERRRFQGWQTTWEHASEDARQVCFNQADAVVRELFELVGETLRGDAHAAAANPPIHHSRQA